MSTAAQGANGRGFKPDKAVDAFDLERASDAMTIASPRATEHRQQTAEERDRWAHSEDGGPPAPDTLAALSLRELRARHIDHRQAQFDAGSDTRAAGERSDTHGEPVIIGTAMPAAIVADQLHEPGSAGATEQLQSLVESCCSRLWVSDGGAAASHGVMLDLGSWMPGCTLEVARAAGALRVTLRGVHDERRNGLERELEDLSAGLAEKLGCPVVTAVESRAAMR
jgi:hypothetical protein